MRLKGLRLNPAGHMVQWKKHNLVLKETGALVCENQLSYLISGSPWASYLNILHFSFLIYRMGIIKLSPQAL